MKILLLSTDPKFFESGSEVQKRIIEYGNLTEELSVIVYTKTGFNPVKLSEKITVYPSNSVLKIGYFWNVIKLAKEIIKDGQNWLVSSQDPFATGLAGWFLKKKFQIKLQIQVHTDFLSPCFAAESLKNRFLVLLAAYLIKKADCFRVVSDRVRQSLSDSRFKIQDSRISALPIFVDIEKLKNAPIKTDLREKYPRHFIILMASRLTREKNIPMAIEAMRGLIRTETDLDGQKESPRSQLQSAKSVLLLIVGDGPELRSLKLLVDSYKLNENVIFESYTNDLASYYKTADLFLLTSNYEGYGRTAVEAATTGLPVVMTDVGVAIGKVVPVGDKGKLVAAILEMINDPEARRGALASQERFLADWPTKDQYLLEMKKLWQNCCL